MENFATREEVNGLGKRLDEVALLKSTVIRNESDIQKIFLEMSKIPEQNQKLLTKIGIAMFLSIGLATWALIAQ